MVKRLDWPDCILKYIISTWIYMYPMWWSGSLLEMLEELNTHRWMSSPMTKGKHSIQYLNTNVLSYLVQQILFPKLCFKKGEIWLSEESFHLWYTLQLPSGLNDVDKFQNTEKKINNNNNVNYMYFIMLAGIQFKF